MHLHTNSIQLHTIMCPTKHAAPVRPAMQQLMACIMSTAVAAHAHEAREHAARACDWMIPMNAATAPHVTAAMLPWRQHSAHSSSMHCSQTTCVLVHTHPYTTHRRRLPVLEVCSTVWMHSCTTARMLPSTRRTTMASADAAPPCNGGLHTALPGAKRHYADINTAPAHQPAS
jgi:hypothetical protein